MRTVVLVAGTLALACATTQSRYVPLGQRRPVLAETEEVEVYTSGAPQRAFERVSRIDVHLEKTSFARSRLADALPEIKRQARLSGAQAVIDVQERHAGVAETDIYHVTAIGIRYVDGPAPAPGTSPPAR